MIGGAERRAACAAAPSASVEAEQDAQCRIVGFGAGQVGHGAGGLQHDATCIVRARGLPRRLRAAGEDQARPVGADLARVLPRQAQV
ncbi:hypothetical protein RZS08_43550, partial [Arthrospira platensis SPKY1]|nr:hypothetical protein [Arthrospira platensis SPKY1]